MTTVAYDPFAATDPHAGVTRLGSLGELLGTADVISIHTPLTPSTRGLIGARELGLMRAGAFLVNTARGELVDTGAVATALESGALGGAALDVFDPEPIPAGHPILAAPNAVLTPPSSAFEEHALRAPSNT